MKVFKLTIDEIEQQIDELMPPVAGARLQRPVAGADDPRRPRATRSGPIFTNNLKETTGVHFHGVEFDDFFQDGVPFVTQKPIVPGETYAYEFTAEQRRLAHVPLAPQRDRPGRSWAARRVHRRPEARTGRSTTASTSGSRTTQLGGFTINGHGFPAVVPVLAAAGRDGPRPVHERGDHDAPVAPPRDADAGRSRATAGRSAAPRSRATPSASTRVSATTS